MQFSTRVSTPLRVSRRRVSAPALVGVLAAIAVGAPAVLAPGAAAARADTDVPTSTVSFADLDLGHASGRTVLERRIAAAVDRVCGERPRPFELGREQAYSACRQAAWAGARRQLAAIYDGGPFARSAAAVVPAAN
jgi:UrcA family protein